jgi:predicted GTPase
MSVPKNVRRVIKLGAAGRDFHNFNAVFRNDPTYKVLTFTAAQIACPPATTDQPSAERLKQLFD